MHLFAFICGQKNNSNSFIYDNYIIMYGDIMSKLLVHAQTILTQDQLNELKERTGESATKDAISKAIDHYFECKNTKVKK